MEAEINRQFDRIRNAAFADPLKPYSNGAMAEAIDTLRRFARQRPPPSARKSTACANQ